MYKSISKRKNENWLSMPVQGSIAPDNPILFLNEADVHQRMGQPEIADRITNGIDANGTVVGVSSYWLRSIGHITNCVAIVFTNGHWNAARANAPDTVFAFRPQADEKLNNFLVF